jgi:hypothetical protein
MQMKVQQISAEIFLERKKQVVTSFSRRSGMIIYVLW